MHPTKNPNNNFFHILHLNTEFQSPRSNNNLFFQNRFGAHNFQFNETDSADSIKVKR